MDFAPRAHIIGTMSLSSRTQAWRFVAAVTALAVVTLACVRWLGLTNAAAVATTYLMVVLVVAATSHLTTAVATSVVATLALNFFFLPPVGTFTIAEPQNWVALFAFLAVSVVASHLSAQARARAEEAVGRRDELARLFDLSRDVLLITDSREALPVLARAIGRRFDLEFVAIAVPRDRQWDVYEAGTLSLALDFRELDTAFAAARPRSISTPDRGPMPGIGSLASTAATCGSSRCASARGRSGCSPSPAAPSRPERWTRWPAWPRSRSSERSCSPNARKGSWPGRATS